LQQNIFERVAKMGTSKAVKALILERSEMAFKRLKNNPEYLEACEKQEISWNEISELYKRFSKDEYMAIQNHYEAEAYKNSFGTDEVYLQGFRDCVKLLIFMGAFDSEGE